MLKNNKKKLIISSILILLPILAGLILWNKLPDNMVTHWGADGNADGMTPKHIAVFLMPTLLLGVHWLCLWLTSLDKKSAEQNKKAMGIIYWIIPILSVAVNGMFYAVALGKTFAAESLIFISIAVLFLYIGNYMPKVTQNRFLGIKIFWTLGNEENWNKTHRLAGKVWMIGGIAILLSVLLPIKIMIFVLIGTIFALIAIPYIYSYCIYRNHKKAGVIYTSAYTSKKDKRIGIISGVIVAIILSGVGFLMFTGNVDLTYEDTYFTVDATYWTDIKIDYQQVQDIAYLEDFEGGYRVSGFGSARLSLGQFRNDQQGNYIAYLYTQCDACVVLRSEGNVLLINGADETATKAIYDTLAAKIK